MGRTRDPGFDGRRGQVRSDSRSDAIGELYVRNHEWLERYATRLLGDSDIAADCVHGAFLKLLRGSTPVDRIKPGYLATVLHNVCIDVINRARRERALMDLLRCASGDIRTATHDVDPVRPADRWAWLMSILPVRPREVVQARTRGLSRRSIAFELGIAERTVDAHWERAKRIARQAAAEERTTAGGAHAAPVVDAQP